MSSLLSKMKFANLFLKSFVTKPLTFLPITLSVRNPFISKTNGKLNSAMGSFCLYFLRFHSHLALSPISQLWKIW